MAAPASNGAQLDFEDFSPDASPLFFPLEWWIPIAFVALVVLLLWRFSRTLPPRKAVTYAFAGAWLGSLVGAAPVMIASLIGSADLIRAAVGIELALSALTLLVIGICAFWPRSGVRHD
jgi:hypothetical protein